MFPYQRASVLLLHVYDMKFGAELTDPLGYLRRNTIWIERAFCFYVVIRINHSHQKLIMYDNVNLCFLFFQVVTSSARSRHLDSHICDTVEALFASSFLHAAEEQIAYKKPWFFPLPRKSFLSPLSFSLFINPYNVTILGLRDGGVAS